MSHRHNTPPRPLLIVSSNATVLFANRAFVLLREAMRRWADVTVAHEDIPGRSLEEVCTLHGTLPTLSAGEADRRSIAASMLGLTCRLGVRGVQWPDSGHTVRLIYWRRIDVESELRDWLLRAAITLLPSLQSMEDSQSHVGIVRSTNKLISLLFDIASAPVSSGLKTRYHAELGEQTFAFIDTLTQFWQNPNADDYNQVHTLLDTFSGTLRALLDKTRDADRELHTALTSAQTISSIAWQLELLQTLTRMQGVAADNRIVGSDTLLEGVDKFAQRSREAGQNIDAFSKQMLSGQRRSRSRIAQAIILGDTMRRQLAAVS